MYKMISNLGKTNNKSDEDGEDESKVSYTISQNQQGWSKFIVRMHNPIGAASEYANLFNLLDSAGEDDEIKLDLSSPGGSLDTCILLRRAIKDCAAHVTCRIGPTCASAAGAIALACDGWEVDDMSTMMVHTGSFAPGYGKVHDIHAASAHTLEQIRRFVRSTYKNFLTDVEIDAVLDGKEMYIGPEELEERLGVYSEARESEYRQHFEEMMTSQQTEEGGDLALEELMDMKEMLENR